MILMLLLGIITVAIGLGFLFLLGKLAVLLNMTDGTRRSFFSTVVDGIMLIGYLFIAFCIGVALYGIGFGIYGLLKTYILC